MLVSLFGFWNCLAIWMSLLVALTITMCLKPKGSTASKSASPTNPTQGTTSTSKEKTKSSKNKECEQKVPLDKTNLDVALILEKRKKRDPDTLNAIFKSAKAICDAGDTYVWELKKHITSVNASWKQIIHRISVLSEEGFDGKPITAKNEKGEPLEFESTLPEKIKKTMTRHKASANTNPQFIVEKTQNTA